VNYCELPPNLLSQLTALVTTMTASPWSLGKRSIGQVFPELGTGLISPPTCQMLILIIGDHITIADTLRLNLD